MFIQIFLTIFSFHGLFVILHIYFNCYCVNESRLFVFYSFYFLEKDISFIIPHHYAFIRFQHFWNFQTYSYIFCIWIFLNSVFFHPVMFIDVDDFVFLSLFFLEYNFKIIHPTLQFLYQLILQNIEFVHLTCFANVVIISILTTIHPFSLF